MVEVVQTLTNCNKFIINIYISFTRSAFYLVLAFGIRLQGIQWPQWPQWFNDYNESNENKVSNDLNEKEMSYMSRITLQDLVGNDIVFGETDEILLTLAKC